MCKFKLCLHLYINLNICKLCLKKTTDMKYNSSCCNMFNIRNTLGQDPNYKN